MLSAIVVTATKEKGSVLSIPAGITVLSSANLRLEENSSLAGYVGSVPGLNLISGGPGQSEVVIRGVSSGFAVASSPSVGTYVDDTPVGSQTANAMGNVTALDLDPAVLSRVETLSGPQGTLYGATAVGGLIRYVTIRPSLTNSWGEAELDGSTVDHGGDGYGLRAMWTGPLVSDKLGVVISGFHRLDPGYIFDNYRNKKDINFQRVDGGLVSALWQPTERFSIDLMALIQDNHAGGTAFELLNSDLIPVYGQYQTVHYGDEYWVNDERLYSLRANYDFQSATLTSITSYERQTAAVAYDASGRDGPSISLASGIPNLGAMDRVGLDHHRLTEEVRLSTPDSGKLVWMGGLFFTHEWNVKPEVESGVNKLTGLDALVGGQQAYVDTLDDSYTEYAAYGDVTYHVTSKFHLMAGLRYTYDTETAFTPTYGYWAGPYTISIARSLSHPLTFAFSPSYRIAHGIVYARIASGFRPGGPTGVADAQVTQGVPATFNPDSLTNYEFGYKGEFPAKRMTFQLDGYDIEWSKMQVLVTLPPPNASFTVTGNAGRARVIGSELSWTWTPIDGLNLSVDGAYTHGYLTEDAPGISAYAGQDLPDVPLVSAHVSAMYNFPVTFWGSSPFLGGSMDYVGARTTEFVTGIPAGMVRPVMPSYRTGNVYAGIRRNGVKIEFYVKNVADSQGLTRIWPWNPDGYSAPYQAAVIPPRTIGFSLTGSF